MIAVGTSNRTWTAGLPRLTGSWSMTSSCTRVKLWMISREQPNGMALLPFFPTASATRMAMTGRMRFPPASG